MTSIFMGLGELSDGHVCSFRAGGGTIMVWLRFGRAARGLAEFIIDGGRHLDLSSDRGRGEP